MGFKSKISPNIGLSASPTTITDTVSASTVHTVIGLSLANTSSSNITVSAKLNKGASSSFLIKEASVLPGGGLVLVGGDQKVVLETGDSITAWASASTSCDVVTSYLSSAA